MRHHLQFAAYALLVAACASCAGTDTTTPSPAPVLTPLGIVSGANVTDTVQVTLAAPLIVAVKTIDGTPRAGVSVRFDAVGSPDAGRAGEHLIAVAPAGGSSFAASDVETTDAQGRASARIQFGTISGAARVAITTADGMTDTARYTVRAGAAVTMTVGIHDTTVNFNDTFPLGAALRDRLGNARTDLLSTSVTTLSGTPSTLSSDGIVHAGANLGRARIFVQGLGKTDSVFVNVVPAATIAAAEGNSMGVRIVQSNGKLIRQLVTIAVIQHDVVRAPSWSPDGSHIAVVAGGLSNPYSIQLFDTLANVRLLSTSPSGAQVYGVQYSRDGQWLYFAEVTQSTVTSISNKLYRMHPDGTGKELVYFSSNTDDNWLSASPSATGDFVILGGVAYISQPDGSILPFPRVARVDVAQQRLVRFTTNGFDATYSPAADRVAMVDTSGRILIAQSSGAGVQALTTATTSATSFGRLSALAWSPDGAYLLASSLSVGRYVVVRVSDGVVVPTALSSILLAPSWR